jgi:hypothetical protein
MVPPMHFPAVFFTLLTAFVVPLAGCTPFHTRNPVTVEVIDGLTGRPVAGANIDQSVQTGKFGRQLHAEATAADDGMATINTFGGASPSIRAIAHATRASITSTPSSSEGGVFFDIERV